MSESWRKIAESTQNLQITKQWRRVVRKGIQKMMDRLSKIKLEYEMEINIKKQRS